MAVHTLAYEQHHNNLARSWLMAVKNRGSAAVGFLGSASGIECTPQKYCAGRQKHCVGAKTLEEGILMTWCKF
jgi:hypothetical protein